MRLGSQLLLLSLGVLALPWLGYRYLGDIQTFLLEGQEQAQQLAAEAIASGLQNRPELFDGGAVDTATALYAYPSDLHLLVDGYDDDWEPRIQPVRLDPTRADVRLRLLQQERFLYLLVDVGDETLVYRNPGLLRLNSSDQLRLLIPGRQQVHQLALAPEGAGSFRPIASDRRWRRALEGGADIGVEAAWQATDGGYRVEIRIPLSQFGVQPALALTVVDVDDPDGRGVRQLIGTGEHPRPLALHSPELQQLVRQLRRSDRHLWIVDRSGQVRAVSNIRDARPDQGRHRPVVAEALAGRAQVRRVHLEGVELIQAAHPIVDANGAILGAVVVEADSRRIGDLKRLTLLKSAGATALVLGVLLTGLLLFSYRLTRRIARLRRETRRSIDDQGRVLVEGLSVEQGSGDQIGDLARDISGMLGRLHQYTRFLERMPRTLRHEMSNPLNTVSTSLEMLRLDGGEKGENSPYLQSAERGVARLSLIINSLTEAASLEEALRSEALEQIDLCALVARYVGHLGRADPLRGYCFEADDEPLHIRGSDLRLEQLLDKLIDNARDFTPAGGEIRVSLRGGDGRCRLAVFNAGPPIPDGIASSLFDSLVSQRERTASEGAAVHLGIGLYVVKLIADFHGARVTGRNIAGGVLFEVDFPLAGATSRAG